jgi:hypothetical protein
VLGIKGGLCEISRKANVSRLFRQVRQEGQAIEPSTECSLTISISPTTPGTLQLE